MNTFLILGAIKFCNGTNLLSCQKNANLIAEQVKEMWSQCTGVLWIELRNELIKCMKVLNSFTEHMALDLVVDLIWFVFPVHFVYFMNKSYKFI